MSTVFLEFDDEMGVTYLNEGFPGSLPVEAADDEIADWRRVLAEYERVQKQMFLRWQEAEIADRASRPRDPPESPPGGVVAEITRGDLCRDDTGDLAAVAARIAEASCPQMVGPTLVFPINRRPPPPAPR